MKSFLIVAVLLVLSVEGYGNVLSEITVRSSVKINGSVDMWDKKKEAVEKAKEKMTFILLRRLLSKSITSEDKKNVESEIIPLSNRYIMGTTVLSYGREKDENFSSYQVRVKFRYSIENFKKILKNKNVLYESLKVPQVAAFIKVLDVSNVEVHEWWKENSRKMSSSLSLIHKKLGLALKEEGYELATLNRRVKGKSLKQMANSLGAHYYVSGEVKLKGRGKNKKLIEGRFYFHETASQRLVSKLDIMSFKEKLEQSVQPPQRGIASVVEKKEKRKDIVKDSFKEAVRVMSSIRDAENITRDLTKIKLIGIRTPLELKLFKKDLVQKLGSTINNVVERKIERGAVTLYARTNVSSRALLSLIKQNFSVRDGHLEQDAKSLFVRIQN